MRQIIASDMDHLSQIGRTMRKTGRSVALVPLGAGHMLHAGHFVLLHAARRQRGAITVLAAHQEADQLEQVEHADVIVRWSDEILWPYARRTTITPADHGLSSPATRTEVLTRIISLCLASHATDVFLGEKDYELLIDVHHSIRDLHLPVKVHGVPTVRTPQGIPISLKNVAVPEEERERVVALSAALTAGAHVGGHGASRVLETATRVCSAADVTPDYLELRGLTLGDPPEEGDARLLAALTVGGVQLVDNVGVALGRGA